MFKYWKWIISKLFKYFNYVKINYYNNQTILIELKFVCPNNYGKCYKYKRSITRHLTFECGVEPKFECYICRKKCSIKGSLTTHMGLIHDLIIPK